MLQMCRERDTNASKTKVMMSSRGNIKNCRNSILMREWLMLLGITNIGKFIIITSLKTHKSYCFHLQTGMLSMLRKCRQINLPRDIEQIELLENVCTQHFFVVVKSGRTRICFSLKTVAGIRYEICNPNIVYGVL